MHRASEKASSRRIQPHQIYEYAVILELYHRTINELGLDTAVVTGSLDELLARLLDFVAMPRELTPETRHYFVSLGERMSAAIFSAYLNKSGRRARQVQFDPFDVGSEDFTDADILEATYPAVSKKLQGDWVDDPAIPIVTSFVAKVSKSDAITTLGSDLTATIIGKALGSREIQIWEDVDGVLTDFPNAILAPYLTYDEATELAYAGAQVLHPQSMRLAMGGGITVIIKNSCNPKAPGTMITQTRDISKSTLSSIVLKSNVPMLDITSKRMPARTDFQAQVLSIFKGSSVSVDCEANWEGKILLTLYPSKLYSPEWMQQELDNAVKELEKIADVCRPEPKSIISLIGNVQKSSFILGKVFKALEGIGVNGQIRRRVPKNQVLSVSLEVADDCEARRCVQVLRSEFLEDGFLPKADAVEKHWPTQVNSSAPSRSRVNSQSKDDLPDPNPGAPTGVRQARAEDAVPHVPLEGVDDDDRIPEAVADGDLIEFYAAASNDHITHIDDGSAKARMTTFTPLVVVDDNFGADDVLLPDADADHGLVRTLGDGGEAPQQELLDAVLLLEGPAVAQFLANSALPPPPPFYS